MAYKKDRQAEEELDRWTDIVNCFAAKNHYLYGQRKSILFGDKRNPPIEKTVLNSTQVLEPIVEPRPKRLRARCKLRNF